MIKPGDLVKLKLLARPSIQFSGRFNSIQTDHSFWQSPSLDGKPWDFPFRPAIVVSVTRGIVVHRGKRGIQLTVFPLFFRPEGFTSLSEDAQMKFVPLDSGQSVKSEYLNGRSQTLMFTTHTALFQYLSTHLLFQSVEAALNFIFGTKLWCPYRTSTRKFIGVSNTKPIAKRSPRS